MSRINDFYFLYYGNKRTENIFLEPIIPFIKNNITTIVEPFAGSCSFSRYIYNKNEKDYKYYVNDANILLTLFCNNFRYNPDYIINKALEINNEIEQSNNKKELYKIKYKELEDPFNFECLDDHLSQYLYYQRTTAKGWKGYYLEAKRDKDNVVFKNYKELTKHTTKFFTENYFYNEDYKFVFDKFKDDETALIYLDPPYYNTDNSMYEGPHTHITNINCDKIIEDIHNLFINSKCKIIFVIKSDYLVDTLFKDFLKFKYTKTYQPNKTNNYHSVFCNFNY